MKPSMMIMIRRLLTVYKKKKDLAKDLDVASASLTRWETGGRATGRNVAEVAELYYRHFDEDGNRI